MMVTSSVLHGARLVQLRTFVSVIAEETDMRSSSDSFRGRRPNTSILVFAVLTLPMVAIGALLAWNSDLGRVLKIGGWFDPLFFQYNVLLWTLFVLLIPFVTYSYVQSMREEREARLHAELDPDDWNKLEQYIKSVIQRQFGMQNYVGSTFTLMAVVAMGLIVMFLLKPLADSGAGLDYGKGANLFLMGAYMVLSPGGQPNVYFERVITSLTAFQFGFLGAYAYFLSHLVRSYFTMDLTPNTFVAMSIRMVTAGLIALVLSFILRDLPRFFGAHEPIDDAIFRAVLPVVSFGIGYFPDWGLLAINKLTRRVMMLGSEERMAATSLSRLSGMSYEHEVRLKRQGYDSVENVAEANVIEMALRTGFSYGQLRTWAGESWLRVRFGRDDYKTLVELTGIRTADQYRSVFGEHIAGRHSSAAQAALGSLGDGALKVKIECVALLVQNWPTTKRGRIASMSEPA